MAEYRGECTMANGKGRGKNMAKNQPAVAVAEKTETAELVEEPKGRGSVNQNGYRTLNVGIGKRHTERFEALGKLSESLGCKDSDLVWLAIDKLIADPPKEAPEWARSSTGRASGFWTVPVRDKSGTVTSMRVVEVAKRGDQDGRQFCRYQVFPDDASKTTLARKRAKNQAKRSALHDLQFIGLNVDVSTIAVEELPKAE